MYADYKTLCKSETTYSTIWNKRYPQLLSVYTLFCYQIGTGILHQNNILDTILDTILNTILAYNLVLNMPMRKIKYNQIYKF